MVTAYLMARLASSIVRFIVQHFSVLGTRVTLRVAKQRSPTVRKSHGPVISPARETRISLSKNKRRKRYVRLLLRPLGGNEALRTLRTRALRGRRCKKIISYATWAQRDPRHNSRHNKVITRRTKWTCTHCDVIKIYHVRNCTFLPHVTPLLRLVDDTIFN